MITNLRRQGQSLVNSRGYLDHKNTLLNHNREIERLERHKQLKVTIRRRVEILKDSVRKLQTRLDAWDNFATAATESEERSLLAYYRRQSIDVEKYQTMLTAMRTRLRYLLMDMLFGDRKQDQQRTLFFLGTRSGEAHSILRAYLNIAKKAEAQIKLYSLHVSGDGQCIQQETKREPFMSFNSRTGSQSSGDSSPPGNLTIDAFPFDEQAGIAECPSDSVGMMIVFSGNTASLPLDSEVGEHSLRPKNNPDSRNNIVWIVETHDGNLNQYRIPASLLDRKLVTSGEIRRIYDHEKSTIDDRALNQKCKFDKDPSLSIEQMIDQRFEQLLWEQLV